MYILHSKDLTHWQICRLQEAVDIIIDDMYVPAFPAISGPSVDRICLERFELATLKSVV